MAGIVEAVTWELEPEDPFEDLGRRSLSHFKPQSPLVSFLFEANSSWNTAWDYDLIEFVLFSRRTVDLEGAVKWSMSQTLFQSIFIFDRRKSTFAVFQQSVRNFGPKYVRNEIKSVRKLNVRNKTSQILTSEISGK